VSTFALNPAINSSKPESNSFLLLLCSDIGVMHEVIRRVAEEAASEVKFDTSNPDSLSSKEKKALKNNKAAKLVNGLIDRGVVKRTVMTSVYGVTYVGARQQIQEKIEGKVRSSLPAFFPAFFSTLL
jgi:hypothetical protein